MSVLASHSIVFLSHYLILPTRPQWLGPENDLRGRQICPYAKYVNLQVNYSTISSYITIQEITSSFTVLTTTPQLAAFNILSAPRKSWCSSTSSLVQSYQHWSVCEPKWVFNLFVFQVLIRFICYSYIYWYAAFYPRKANVILGRFYVLKYWALIQGPVSFYFSTRLQY